LFWIVQGGVRYSGMFAWVGQFGNDAFGKDIRMKESGLR
jgi:hypothetical protein